MSRSWKDYRHSLARKSNKPETDTRALAGPGRAGAPILLERIEPRLLLAADPLLIAAYALNETTGTTTADASGNGITGTLTNGPVFATGHAGNGIRLDGVNDFVNLGNPTALRLTGSMTISAWINASAFPVDDAAIVSKRTNGESGFQLDTTVDRGTRTIGFKLTTSTGGEMFRYGATTLQANTWYFVTGVYDATAQTLHVYLNGQLDDGALRGTVAAAQQNSTANVNIGQRPGNPASFNFNGTIDDVRIYSRALTQAEIQTDMLTPVAPAPNDTTPPSVPTGLSATPVSATQINLAWTAATDNVAVTGYQVFRDGAQIAAVTTTSYADTGRAPGTTYQYQVRAVDAAGNQSALTTAVPATTPANDTVAPTVSMTSPANGATVSGSISLTATASDNVAVTGVQFLLDGAVLGAEDTTSPYALTWDTRTASNGTHTLAARARDAAGNATTATAVTVTVSNAVATGSVAAYAFNETTGTTTADASGNGITGTLTNGPVFATGHAGNGIRLDGVNDFVNLGNPTALRLTGSMTISAWINSSAFPVDDAAIVSKRTNGESGFQLDTTVDRGTRTIGFKLTTSTGGQMARYGATTLQANTWYFVTGVYDATAQTLHVYLNGQLDDGVLLGTVAAAQQNSTANVNIGQRPGNPASFNFNGTIDDVRIYSRALTQAEIQTDMLTPVAPAPNDTTPPSVPTGLSATPVSATQINLAWTAATDNVAVTGYQVFRDGAQIAAVTTTSYADTGRAPGTTYQYQVRAVDAAGNPSALTTAVPATTPANDTVAPTVAITSPTTNAQVSAIVTVTAIASDNVAVAGVQFMVDGQLVGVEDTATPYALNWDTRTTSNGAHTLTALARDAAGNTTLSAPVVVNVANTAGFRNEILATGLTFPIAMKFLPDGRMLVAEFTGAIKILQAPYTQADPTPFLQLTNIAPPGGEIDYGIMDIALDPNFAQNHYFYVFYTAATPNRDRLSRFTANSTLTGTIAGSELVIYQDPNGDTISNDHHGGAITFGSDGKIYVTTGDHYYDPSVSQQLTSPRGKILRFNTDGTIPTDNPFYDGSGPNYDAIWALGLRNPYRAFFDTTTNRLLIGDVGGNDPSTAREEVNIGARGANYGWPNVEGSSNNPAYTNPLYFYPHNGRDASITGGFVYRGTQFPANYQGAYFFGDYTQNWIRALTFDANGNVSGVINFEPADGSADGPYGDIVYLTQGPEGALYYIDLGFSEVSGTYGVSKIRRISYTSANQPPIVNATANPLGGPTPLTVSFSSAGSSDPENLPLTYSWTFGDGTTSTAANPTHTYANPGPYVARLTVSDGVNSSLSTPINIQAGNAPTATILGPADGRTFRAGDVINFSGTASDIEDGTLPPSAYTWNIDFLHEGHVHPGTVLTGATSGVFTIPTEGHDFSSFTRYRITLTVTDSNGLKTSTAVTIFPEKVNLSFDTAPSGATIYLDGIAHTAPFVYDTLVGFHHTVEARNQTIGASTYTFASWSDGGAQSHVITVPATNQSLTATYTVTVSQAPPAFVQVSAATPQTNQSVVSVTYTSAQTVGNTNIIAIGWNDATTNITSVVDSAGNVYQLAVPTARGTGISQAIYYASNIRAAAAGTNTLTVTFSGAAPYVDIRASEYSGLDPLNPFDVGASASGNSATASSPSVTTTAARELFFGAGITAGAYSAAGSGFTSRIITVPDADIVEDRLVTALGSYNATAPLSGSAAWLMQVAAFRAASQV